MANRYVSSLTLRQGELDEEATQRRTDHPHPAGSGGETSIREVRCQHNITEQALYRWRNKSGVTDVPDARRLKDLESENAKLKRLVAEQMLVIDGLKEFSRKK